MDPLSSPRKRKRPTYLDDFETINGEDAPAAKKSTTPSKSLNSKPKTEFKQHSYLCEAILKVGDKKWNLTSKKDSSKLTLSDFLNKLFKQTELPSDFVTQLQNQDIGVKQSVTLSFETDKQTQSKNGNLETPVKKKKTTKVTQDQDVYIIESLREKKGNNFLVKWENYPEEENTWEPRTAIPGFILKFYDMDLKRLGQPAPSLPLEAKANATKVVVEEKRKTTIKKENKKATNKKRRCSREDC